MTHLACLFPGQGAQYAGMGQKLYDNSPLAREVFDEAGDALGMDMRRLCCEADMAELTRTENTQPALLTVGVAAFRMLTRELGLAPTHLAGHSLGELTALTCAGAMRFADAVQIARMRGQLMQEAGAGVDSAMAAVGKMALPRIVEACDDLCAAGEYVTVANFNSPAQVVVSGLRPAVEALGERLRAQGALFTLLKVSAPFHCRLMAPAAVRFREELQAYQFADPALTVIANTTAQPYESGASVPERLVEQIASPVRWAESMQTLRERMVTTVVDVGPGMVMRNLAKANCRDLSALAREDETDVLPADTRVHQPAPTPS